MYGVWFSDSHSLFSKKAAPVSVVEEGRSEKPKNEKNIVYCVGLYRCIDLSIYPILRFSICIAILLLCYTYLW